MDRGHGMADMTVVDGMVWYGQFVVVVVVVVLAASDHDPYGYVIGLVVTAPA
jgi:hypothetical protein